MLVLEYMFSYNPILLTEHNIGASCHPLRLLLRTAMSDMDMHSNNIACLPHLTCPLYGLHAHQFGWATGFDHRVDQTTQD
jgi:hypothetical protein